MIVILIKIKLIRDKGLGPLNDALFSSTVPRLVDKGLLKV